MTAEEYRKAIHRLKLSQVEAGDLFRVGARTSRRWALGEASIPASIAMLLRLMLKRRVSVEHVAIEAEGEMGRKKLETVD